MEDRDPATAGLHFSDFVDQDRLRLPGGFIWHGG